MGFAMVTMDAPVTKTSSSILLFKEDVVAKSLETACINCGRCVEICPSRIIPSRLADFQREKMRHLLLHGMDWNVWNVVPAVMSVRRNVS